MKLNLDGRPSRPFFFLSEAQAEYSPCNLGSLFLHYIVIVTRPHASLSIVRARQAMASVDPNLPIISIRTLREQVATQFTQQRLIARLTSLFGVLSLVLASTGLYGVTDYNVGHRANEIGVRMALGASRGAVIRPVLQGAFLLTAFGLVLGIPLPLATGSVLRSQLYGLNPFDPTLFATAAVVLGLFGLMPRWFPVCGRARSHQRKCCAPNKSRGFLPHIWAGCTALLHVSIVAEILFRPQGFHGLDRSGAPRR